MPALVFANRSGIRRCWTPRLCLFFIAFLISSRGCLGGKKAFSHELTLRRLQVTGAYDWPSTSRANDEPPAQRTQETVEANTTGSVATSPASQGASAPLTTSQEDDAVDIAESSRFENQGTFALNKMICGVILAGMIVFLILVLKRRQELARWREYRTHQLLPAQDEAFDMNYDETFDLELVEGSLPTRIG